MIDLQIYSSSISQNIWHSGNNFHYFNGLLYVAVKYILIVFFVEYDVNISFDKLVVPLKWFSSNPIISNFKFLIFIIVLSLIYFYNNYLDIINILLSLISILVIILELSILWILNLLKSLNLSNKSLVNCGTVSVGAGVIINTFNLFFNYLIIIPPII